LKIYLSKKADIRLIEYLKSKGHELNLVDGSFIVGNKLIKSKVSEPILCHPDVYYCSLGDEMYLGDVSLLDKDYPKDVLYNAARVGNYYICSKYTSSNLLERAKSLGLKPIIVPQGYVKCNLAIVDDRHVITEDDGIFKAIQASGSDIECLLVTRGYAVLPGYKYGFIGGSCGRVKDEIIFNGDLSKHPDFSKISDFVVKAGLSLKYFDAYTLVDIGSILTINNH